MHLISLNISSVLTAYHFLILVDNNWPLLRKLKLKLIFSDTTLVIQKLVAAPWSQLEELDLGPSTLKIPDAQLLVRKWFEGTAVVSTRPGTSIVAGIQCAPRVLRVNVRNALAGLLASHWSTQGRRLL